ncbi:hypothetical protein CDD80_5385 [Ophiocordyceps camponoti-rufipedis]|uniref:Uncharacterized protein n=1 Tax=Ophiocordyceps camponoti-rufipedis TaxID=2004952 RepID=A0A2C5YMA3_9HYPO|nr:hypothetical protein CDD80_5385 [Ophiocordyceps camponoti-rufipedis]
MRSGNKDFTFFGELADPDAGFIAICTPEAKEGDEYLLTPFLTDHDSPASDLEAKEFKTKVQTVRCLDSDLVCVENADLGMRTINLGWRAKLQTAFPTNRIPIRLMDSVTQHFEIPDAKKQQYLQICTERDTVACTFNAIINNDHALEILDSQNQRIASLPPLTLKRREEQGPVMGRLQHLAVYKYFEAFENRNPDKSFESSFESLQDRGVTQCEEIIKVLITSRPTEFPSLSLPGISPDGKDKVRGSEDELSRFLSRLQESFRTGDGEKSQMWSTRTFVITTFMGEDEGSL